MLFIKVKTSEGEATRKKLAGLGVLSQDYKIIQKEGFLYLPISREVANFEIITLRGQKFKTKKPKTLKEALAGKLSNNEIAKLVTSFDLMGDIAIIEIPDELEKKEKEIANALMAVHSKLRVIAKKLSGMEGEFRVRPLKVIAGEQRTETEYKESGCRIKLDVAKVYFSVRLSHERERVAQLVKPNENVLVMFAGVGPFALTIAKKKPNANVFGIELNPVATEYFKQNIALNTLKNCEAIQGDVRQIVPAQFTNWADRILMPLPKSAEDFLDLAFIAAKKGTVIHFYNFGKEGAAFEEAKKKIQEAARIANVTVEFINERVVRPYAPGVVQVCMDFKVRK